MGKDYKITLLLCLFFALTFTKCINDSNKKQSIYIEPIFDVGRDTVANYSMVVGKAYLSNDSLFRVAKSNGIENYLTVMYNEQVNSEIMDLPQISSHLTGDTAIISFQPKLDSLRYGEVRPITIRIDFHVDFLQNASKIDTTFIVLSDVFVKGQ